MKKDIMRHSGFYWVRFEGEVIVAEYVLGREARCTSQFPHWHVPGSSDCFMNRDVCELFEGPLRYVKLNRPENFTESSAEFHGMAVVADSETPRDEIQLRDKEGNAEPVASETGETKSASTPLREINIPGHRMRHVIADMYHPTPELHGQSSYQCECGWKLDYIVTDALQQMGAYNRALCHLSEQVLKSAASHVGQTK